MSTSLHQWLKSSGSVVSEPFHVTRSLLLQQDSPVGGWLVSVWSVITTRAQKLLERFNLTYFHCSNKQSGWCQMQKMLLNNWSIIEANIHDEISWSWEDTATAIDAVITVTRMFDAVVETDPNRRTLMCMQFFTNSLNVKWNKPKTKDGVYLCSNTHAHVQQSFPPEQQLHSRHKCWAQWADWSLDLLRQFLGFVCWHQTTIRLKLRQQQTRQTWVSSNNTAYCPDISHIVSLMHLISLHFIHLGERHVKDKTFTHTCG